MIRIPSLDGLRAISILMVILGHSFKSYFKWIDIANLGVRFFFVISAYLIVGILLKEVRNNSFSVKRFYFKRIMRTFPAFYFYLVVVFAVLILINRFEFSQLWRAPIYLENYHPRYLWSEVQWFIGHSWSLAVEEQFYIVIAFLFWLLTKKRLSEQGIITCFIVILILAPVIRVFYMYVSHPIFLVSSLHRSFETVMDSIAIGGLAAMVNLQNDKYKKIISFLANNIWILLCLIFLLQSFNSSKLRQLFGLQFKYLYNGFGLTVINFSIVFVMLTLINNPKQSILAKILNTKPFIYIGMWSYSLYLWQQVWLFSGWEINFGFKLLGIFLSSIFSYYLIEKKFLDIRDKYLTKNYAKDH